MDDGGAAEGGHGDGHGGLGDGVHRRGDARDREGEVPREARREVDGVGGEIDEAGVDDDVVVGVGDALGEEAGGGEAVVVEGGGDAVEVHGFRVSF